MFGLVVKPFGIARVDRNGGAFLKYVVIGIISKHH